MPQKGGAQAFISYAYGPLVLYPFAWTAIIALKPGCYFSISPLKFWSNALCVEGSVVITLWDVSQIRLRMTQPMITGSEILTSVIQAEGGSSLITSWNSCSGSSTILLCECALSSKKSPEFRSSHWKIKVPSSFHFFFSWTQKSTSHCFWNSLGFILPPSLIGERRKVSPMYVHSWWPSVLLAGASHWPLYLDGTGQSSTCLWYLLCLNVVPD